VGVGGVSMMHTRASTRVWLQSKPDCEVSPGWWWWGGGASGEGAWGWEVNYTARLTTFLG
jgi:hypothetical protein